MNNKGFTLIELLATISLLAVLMLIAVPNVIGVVNKNKNKTYIEDAKKLVSLAEYKVRSDSQYKPAKGISYCFSMNFLGTGDFDTSAPNGGTYLYSNSYVRVYNNNGELKYYVVIVENKDTNKYVGVTKEIESNNLYKDDITGNIETTSSLSNINTCSGSRSY